MERGCGSSTGSRFCRGAERVRRYPVAGRMCYNPSRRGTSCEASPRARAGCAERAETLVSGGFGCGGRRGDGCFRVARGVRSALLSRVLAKAGVAPLQADLQSVRVLHVLRGLHLAAGGQRSASDLARVAKKQGLLDFLVCCLAPDTVAAGSFQIWSRTGLSKE